MRLAWFTPLPPVTSGVAQYNMELLPLLSPVAGSAAAPEPTPGLETETYRIDAFVDGAPGGYARPDGVRVRSAHDFLWQQAQAPYDLTVYQLGNAPCHNYLWPYLVRYPGLVVLHDGQLHQSRARHLLHQHRREDYRVEFRFNHPDAPVEAAQMGILGLLGPLTYLWSMLGVVVESSRRLLVHNAWLAGQIRTAHPAAAVEVVEMGVPSPRPTEDAARRVRARHGIRADAVLFIAFGQVTPEKRLRQAIQALAQVGRAGPSVHLLLAGQSVDHYDPVADARTYGLARDRLTVSGFVPQEDVADYLESADVCLCLRWPTTRESSASWLRCVAAGKPTVVTDLVHTADIPSLDPRSWSLLHAPLPRQSAVAPPGGRDDMPLDDADPVCVSIDIVDEDHSLELALRRLAEDPELRQQLGRAARQLWAERFQMASMAAGYRAAIGRAVRTSLPDPAHRARLPRHLFEDGTELATQLTRTMGLDEARISGLWHGQGGRS